MNVPLLIVFVFFYMSLVKFALLVCFFVPCLYPSCLNKLCSAKFIIYLSALWLASLNLLCELSDQPSVQLVAFLEDTL